MVVCTVPLILAVIIMGASIIHPSWDRSGWRMSCLLRFRLVAFCGESIVAKSDFKYLY